MSEPPKLFSDWLLARLPNEAARQRVTIAKRRVQSVLDTHTVAHQKTLEQKIGDQGPTNLRVDPHLVGYAIKDLLELNRLKITKHPATGAQHWYSNPATAQTKIGTRLDILAPLYASVSGHGFGNLTGDALELAVFKCLDKVFVASPGHAFLGQFDLASPKNKGRYSKIHPPKALAGRTTKKEFDFIQLGYGFGGIGIECKNLREWVYPKDELIRELIIKADDLGVVPLLVARRIHYTTITNFLHPAGILFHESLFQYYPEDHIELATKVKDKNLLGFTDVEATDTPKDLTLQFLRDTLPALADHTAKTWHSNRAALASYAREKIDIHELYRAIGSPAAQYSEEDIPF